VKGCCGEDEALGGPFYLAPAAPSGPGRLQGSFGFEAISGRFGRGNVESGTSWL